MKDDKLMTTDPTMEKPMELRDQFALHIINGLIQRPHRSTSYHEEREELIRDAYKMADLMRKIRLAPLE